MISVMAPHRCATCDSTCSGDYCPSFIPYEIVYYPVDDDLPPPKQERQDFGKPIQEKGYKKTIPVKPINRRISMIRRSHNW